MDNLESQETSTESVEKTIYRLPVSEVYAALGTSEKGLTRAEAEERLKKYGKNVLKEIKGKPLILKFLANFTHLMAILLWIAGIVA